EPVAEVDLAPVEVLNAPRFPNRARSAEGTVVLEPTHDVEGGLLIDVDVVELRQRQVLDELPRLPPVPGQVHSAVVSVGDKAAILRVDVPGVVIAVHPGERQQGLERLPAVVAQVERAPDVVYPVFVLRVHSDLAVVERTVTDAGRAVDDLPG